MPWSPSFEDAQPDPRLTAYRGRAARLTEGDQTAGYVLVETDFTAEARGGLLWWRRWSTPAEFAIVFTKVGDDEPRTTAVSPADFALFEHWAQDGYDDQGRKLAVVWLDDAESERVHHEVFAHQH